MKYMLIGISILGMQVNINVATNEVISLIASKGAVPYGFIRESQNQLLRASVKDVNTRNVPTSNFLSLENAERFVPPLGSPKMASPIPIDLDEEESGAENLNERSIFFRSSGRNPFSHSSFDSCSPTFPEDEEEDEELSTREGAELASSTSDSDEDLFNCETQWVRMECFVSDCNEDRIPAVVVPRSTVTVTCTRTNLVTEVPFGSHHSSAVVTGNPRGSVSATPINTVSRPLRPSTRTHERRLKEAQKNNMLPVKFGINPRTNEERVLIERRKPECLTPFRPLPPRDLTKTPFLSTDQPSQVLPVQMCVSSRANNESQTSEYSMQAEPEHSQEIET